MNWSVKYIEVTKFNLSQNRNNGVLTCHILQHMLIQLKNNQNVNKKLLTNQKIKRRQLHSVGEAILASTIFIIFMLPKLIPGFGVKATI